ncbi:hypothetical protein D3C73_1352800 [compost metagenome]
MRVLCCCTVVPRVHERLSRDGVTVGELLVLLDLDGEVLCVGRLNGLRQLVYRLSGRVITDKAGEDQSCNLSAANLVDIGRHQRTLRLRAVGNDDLVRVTRRCTGVVAAAATATGSCEGDDRRYA